MIAMMESRTYIVVPPGATVREQLDDRGMTQKEFAARMDMSQKHVSRLINGEVQLTPDTARKLELVFGTAYRRASGATSRPTTATSSRRPPRKTRWTRT